MLGLPGSGLVRSLTDHNSNFIYVCDWIEASLLFETDELSKSDVIDILMENRIYDSQDFAKEFVDNAWLVLQKRLAALGNPLGIKFSRNGASREQDWTYYPAYSFCMALSCSQLYPKWEAGCSDNFGQQGKLFEDLSLQSFTQMLPGWEVKPIGWSSQNAVKLKDTVNEIIGHLNEHASSEIATYVTAHANELGLDLLAFYSFKDKNASAATLMVQCASGKNWKDKRRTPDLNIWNKVISFNSPPMKAFVMPFSFTSAEEFRRESVSVAGMFIERYRLLNPTGGGTNWASDELNNALLDWLWPRVASLPTQND